MLAIELRSKVAPVLKSLMIEHGVIALPAGPTVLRLLPPLVITEEEIDHGVRAVAAAVRGASHLMDRAAAIELDPRARRHSLAVARTRPRPRHWLVGADAVGRLRSRIRGRSRQCRRRSRRARRRSHDRPARPHRHRARRHPSPHRGDWPTARCSSAAAASTRRGRSRRSSPPAARLGRCHGLDSSAFASSSSGPSRRKPRPARARDSSHRVSMAHDEAAPDRVRDRRAEPLAPRHARLQGSPAAGPRRTTADGAHGGTGRQCRDGRGRFVELGGGSGGGVQRRSRQGVRSAESRACGASSRRLPSGCRTKSMLRFAWRLPLGLDAEALVADLTRWLRIAPRRVIASTLAARDVIRAQAGQ